MAVTMKQVAQAAGISQPAVSAIFHPNGTTQVSEATRKRVLEIAARMGFVPNNAAQRLRGGASRTIGLVGVPFVSIPQQAFYHDLSVLLGNEGYQLVTSSCPENERKRSVRELISRGADGILFTVSPAEIPEDVPCVLCPTTPLKEYDITVDCKADTANVTRELLSRGRRLFAMLFAEEQHLHGQQIRDLKFSGMQETLAEAGAAPGVILYPGTGGDELVHTIREKKLDAVLCANDYLGGMLVSQLLRYGLRVPEDVMVTGAGGLSLCDLFAVPLATLVLPNRRWAELAAQLLLERIRNKECNAAPQHTLLQSKFYPSASTGDVAPDPVRLFGSKTYPTIEQNSDPVRCQNKTKEESTCRKTSSPSH